MANTLRQLSQLCLEKGLSVCTAESCTGGGVSHAITAVPGSSQWFDRGFVTYSNQSKIDMLGVNPETLEKFGAVSEQTALEMAHGALKNSTAQMSVAVTGVAGPDGGTSEKPVGTVCFAWAGENIEPRTEIQHFQGDRASIRQQSVDRALEMLIFVTTTAKSSG